MSLGTETTTNGEVITTEDARKNRLRLLTRVERDVTDALKREDHTALCVAVLLLVDQLKRDS